MTSRRAWPLFALLFALVGCANNTGTNTPPAPTPPQVQIANDIGALEATLTAALPALQTAKEQGKITNAELLSVETKVIAPMATAGKALNAELRSGDDWTVMKPKLLRILTAAALANASANIPPGAQAAMSTAVALYNAIAGAVGGPTL